MNLLRNLRFFVTIVDEGGFGPAADELGVTQPPVSQGLRRLEDELGVRLLDRSAGRIELTDAGAALLPAARQLLAGEDDFRNAAIGLRGTGGPVRLCLVPELPAQLVVQITAAAVTASTSDVTVTVLDSATAIDGLARHHLDVAVVHHPTVAHDFCSSDVLGLPTWLLHPQLAAVEDSLAGLLRTLRLPVASALRGAPAAEQLFEDTILSTGSRAGVRRTVDLTTALALVAAGQACAITADPALQPAGLGRTPSSELLPLLIRTLHRHGARDDVVHVANAVTTTIAGERG